VLRGAIGGVAVGFALPPLEAMFNGNGTAHADGTAIPTRLGIFFWGNGVKPDRWVPTATGSAWAPSPSLMPLQTLGVRDYVNVVSGMTVKASTERGHHSGTVSILSGGPLTVQPAGGAPYRYDLHPPEHRSGRGPDHRHDDAVQVARAGHLHAGQRQRGDDAALPVPLRSRQPPTRPSTNPTAVFNRIFGAGSRRRAARRRP